MAFPIPQDWKTTFRFGNNQAKTSTVGKSLQKLAENVSLQHVDIKHGDILLFHDNTDAVIEKAKNILQQSSGGNALCSQTDSLPSADSTKRKLEGGPVSLCKRPKLQGSEEVVPQDESFAMHLELDTLLSRLPYKKMMRDMFGGLKINSSMLSIPYVTRVYEESYMREPMNTAERECVNGSKCECMFIDKSNKFIGVEFLLPGEESSSVPQMCVLCCRATTQRLFYDIVFEGSSFPGVIQRYGNLHSVPNEYSREVMLICPPYGPVESLPLPIVSHARNRYSVIWAGGVKYLKQHRVNFQ